MEENSLVGGLIQRVQKPTKGLEKKGRKAKGGAKKVGEMYIDVVMESKSQTCKSTPALTRIHT